VLASDGSTLRLPLRRAAETDEVPAAHWQQRPWTAVLAEAIGWAARRWL
jgi:hypothetical protein